MADEHPTKVRGTRILPLQFGNHLFQFPFLFDAVNCPILGADFLTEFDLLVDSAKRQVLQYSSMEPLSPLVNLPANLAIASLLAFLILPPC